MRKSCLATVGLLVFMVPATALSSQTSDFALQFPEAKQSFYTGRYAHAITTLNSLLEDHSLSLNDKIATMDLLARSLSFAGQRVRAQDVFVELLRIDRQYRPTDPDGPALDDFEAALVVYERRYGQPGTALRTISNTHLGLAVGVGSAGFLDADRAVIGRPSSLDYSSTDLRRSLLLGIDLLYARPVLHRLVLEASAGWKRSGADLYIDELPDLPYTEQLRLDFVNLTFSGRYSIATAGRYGFDVALGVDYQILVEAEATVGDRARTTTGSVDSYLRDTSVRPHVGLGFLLARGAGGIRLEVEYSPESFGSPFESSEVSGDLDISELGGRLVFLF